MQQRKENGVLAGAFFNDVCNAFSKIEQEINLSYHI